MEVHEHRQKLAHELGVISQLVYKHFSAHRSTKYFQALKKVDRHMYEFSKLKVFDITSCDSSENAEYRKRRAVTLLSEVEGNSLEVIERSLAELALGFFIPYHSLVVATISNLFTHIKVIKAGIQKRITSGSACEKRLKFPVQGSRSMPTLGTGGKNAVDVGVKIARDKASLLKSKKKWTSSSPDINTETPFDVHPGNSKLDLGIPITRKTLKHNNIQGADSNGFDMEMSITCDATNTAGHISRVNERDCVSTDVMMVTSKSVASVPTNDTPEHSNTPTLRDACHLTELHIPVVNDMDSPPADSLMVTSKPSPTIAPDDDDRLERRSTSSKKPPTIDDACHVTELYVGETDEEMHHKTRKFKKRSYRNIPLRHKHYHSRFLLHCYRNNTSTNRH